LRKTYDGKVEPVRGLSLKIQTGECFSLLGPNGTGTTTIEILEGRRGALQQLDHATSQSRRCVCASNGTASAGRLMSDGRMMRRFQYIVLLIAMAAMMAGWQCAAQNSAADSPTGFPPLDQWRSAILAGDATSLKALYSVDPVVQVDANGTKSGADADINFWLGLKARDMKLKIVRLTQGTGKRGVIAFLNKWKP
jgi:hypothetical protein